MRNIHRYFWYKIIRNTEHRPHGAAASRPPHRRRLCVLCFWLFYIINVYEYSSYIPYIFPKYLPYISLGCFWIYGVKSRFGHEQMTTFGSISHVLVPQLTFWGNFIMVLHGFVWRSPKSKVLRPNEWKIRQKTKNKTKQIKSSLLIGRIVLTCCKGSTRCNA